ncbi:MAG: hypothetical protein AAB475_00805 [Patescibacteria group bacterium]
MFKKILIIILIIFIIVIIGLLVVAFSVSKKSGGDITVQDSFRDLVSFGESPSNDFSRKFDSALNTDTDFIGPDDMANSGDDIDVSSLLLRKVASFPVAGVSSIINKDAETIIRFIARENGHIFEIPADSATQKRISNTTILRIWDTLWLKGAERFIARFLDEESSEIESFYAEIIPEGEIENTSTLDGSFLPKNITEITYSEDKDKIFYISSSGDGSVGIISNPDGSKKVQILDSPISEWRVEWPEENTITLTTKPSFDAPGYLYFLDVETEKLSNVLSGINGLTTLVDSKAEKVLFTHNQANRLLLSVFDIDEGEVTDLPLWTLTEKCVWSEKNSVIIYCGASNFIPRGESLDLWYQGITSFSDSVWMIDIETQTVKVLADPVNIAGEEIDLIKPVLSQDENYLFFINKKDSSLWSLRLE